ncbi:MAG: sulfite exporter TauE/SafE family protein [Acidobacteria bacterium]|nr:sulfite exporter TauE/SafE family protein [Acidobacteriota bacterium]
MPDLLSALVAFAAAFAAGVINSVAGGGTLVTFPALVWLGVPSIVANATNAVSMTPGSMASAWGYRRELGSSKRMLVLMAPSLAGGICGALLLKLTPPGVFDLLVPFLILFATLLFMAQQQVQRILKTQAALDHSSSSWLVGAVTFQFFVALYGGYFGAGMGILMLAALSIIGLTDIHQMNGWKNVFGTCINGIAAVYFIASGMVSWPYAIVMTVGAIAGGAGGAGLARRLGRDAVRRIVIVVGFGMALSLYFKR